jgi:hypothetical protein
MNHQEATQQGAVEKYLLDELAPPERDEFEEHFFDCPECAEDLRMTAAFLDTAARELERFTPERPAPERPAPERPAPKRAGPSRFAFLFRPAFAAPAFATLLLVIAYQNGVVYPRLAAELAASRTPEILASVSLIGGNSRGTAIPSVTLPRNQPLLLTLDIPTAERFTSYTCVLMAPSGAVVGRVPVSAEQAKDTVSIRVPLGQWRSGEYRLIVQGHSPSPEQAPAQLASYRFTLNYQ